ncbi:RNA-dependent RNA polymerase [Beihai hermit crab virus 3]|uniref:RNA-directed RNA polymerase L n=1 Tax=Beihai hermit crab virus 3 TaxID=1922390 RepID=A0A1L3KMV0_9VIRU|nr:RNA-dependent RNA polymerase [Beihai hermit crab virus 3]APG78635.1 RNA-dependent RNA polymerase [Beihai hermit crab virus 3]
MSQSQSSGSPVGIDLLTYPEKFDTALKLGPLRNCVIEYKTSQKLMTECLNLKTSQPDHQMVPELFKGLRKSDLVVSSLVQAKWLQQWLGAKTAGIKKKVSKIPNCQKVIDAWKIIASNNIGFVFSALPPDHLDVTKSSLQDLMDNLPKSLSCQSALHLFHLDRKILNDHKRLALDCQQWIKSPSPKPKLNPVVLKIPECKTEIRMGWDVGVIIIDEVPFVLNRDLFLLWVNKLGELSCALLYCASQTQLFGSTGVEKLRGLLKILVRTMLRWSHTGDWDNQTGFTLCKTLEAVGVGLIIQQEDQRRGWTNEDFIIGTIQGLLDDNVITGGVPESTDIYSYLKDLTSPEISELIGVAKLVGHPDIELEKGLRRLYTRTHEDIRVDVVTVKNSAGLLVFEFCQRYYQRTGTWPPLLIPATGNFDRLRRFVEGGVSPLSVEFTSNIGLSYEEWADVQINPCIENDYWESPLEFLKDTALSPSRESTLAFCLKNKLRPNETFQESVKEIRRTGQYRLSNSNRLIIQFLLSDDSYWQSLRYREKWATYESMDELEAECATYWVIKLTPKERELNMLGRFFGASPYPERDRRIQVEGVLAGMMKKMFPEQMLTATELEFNQKLIKFRNYRRLYPNHHVVQLCFDFQAWNNYMRADFIDRGIGPVLDGIFNTHAYSRTMEFYERALVHCETSEMVTAWMGQLGGIEGLNQATWTLAALTGLKVALGNLGFKFEVSVKGDDCRAAVMIPKEDCPLSQLHVEAGRIKQVLTEYCLNTGMHLKPEETFVSLSLIASSKQYQLDDIILPCGLKQALKLAHHSNAAFPTSQDVIADIMSSCHSACFYTPFLIQTWMMGVLVALLRLNADHKIFKMWNSSQVAGFGLWPQVLGGPGMLPLEMFVVRGENDLVSISFALFRYIFQTSTNEGLTSILWNILCIPDKTSPHWKLLLTDPYSLNKDHPVSPSQYLRSQVRKQIKNITRNPMLRSLMSRSTEEGEEALVSSLVSLTPAHAKVMTAIYENSPFAILDKVLARVDNSASIFALLGAHRGYVRTWKGLMILKSASKLHREQVAWWMRIVTLETDYRPRMSYGKTVEEFTRECPTSLAQNAREMSWGIPIFGITYPSITQQFSLIPADFPVPAEFIVQVKPHCGRYTVKGSSQVNRQTAHSHPFFSSPDSVNPWIGGKTESKTRLPGHPLMHKSAALPRIEMLLEVYARTEHWCPQIGPLIKWLVRMMVDLTDDEFARLKPTVEGGCHAHRSKIAAYSPTTTPNFRHNLLQHTERNYDRIQFTHAGLNTDYSLNFAAINIFHSFLLVEKFLFGPIIYPPRRYFALPHQNNDTRVPLRFDPCASCVADVSDRPMRITLAELPEVDLEESKFIVLPDCDVAILRRGLEVLAQQRQLNIMDHLNLTRRGTAQYLRAANHALVNRMLVDARRLTEDINLTVPGGLIDDAALQALGISYQPFAMKFLSWMNPDHVVEAIMSEVKLELLATYTRDTIVKYQVSSYRHRGTASLILPILKYFTQATAHQNLARAFHAYQRGRNLQEPMVGIDIKDPISFTNWVYRIGLRDIQSPQPGDRTHHYRIITTHNVSQELLLTHIQPKVENILQGGYRHTWQNYHRAGGSVLASYGAESPCDLWCPREGEEDNEDRDNHFLTWMDDALNDDNDFQFRKWLHRALLLPICITPTISDRASMIRCYHHQGAQPALRLGPPQLELYRDHAQVFSTLNSFMGFDFEAYMSGQCPHGTYTLEEGFMEYMEVMVADWMARGNERPFLNWRDSWAQKVMQYADLEIIHMEEESAILEVSEHYYRVGTLISETQARLMDPDVLPALMDFQLNLHQRVLPTSPNAVAQDRIGPQGIIFNPVIPGPTQWTSWNQHLRIRGFSGAASCKLWEIMGGLGLMRNRNLQGVSLHLADGQGGFTTLIGQYFPNFEVYFNTWQGDDATPGGLPGDWIATIADLTRLHCGMTDDGDLCQADVREGIIANVQAALGGQNLTLGTFDAERYEDSERDDNLTMIENMSRIFGNLAGPQTILIVKLFWVEWMVKSSGVLYLLDACQQYRIIKPHSSRENNFEFYLVVKGLSYPFQQFNGTIHLRRYHRFRAAAEGHHRRLQMNDQEKRQTVAQLVDRLYQATPIPLLTAKQFEISLRLPAGLLAHRTYWIGNRIKDRLYDQLEIAWKSFPANPAHIHSTGSGRRRVGLGGVKKIVDLTSQILRLSGCVKMLSLNNGWIYQGPEVMSGWLELVHSGEWQLEMTAAARQCRLDILKYPLWESCQDHEFCLVSRVTPPVWAHQVIHMGITHEFGTGCDTGVRMITLGFLARDAGEMAYILDHLHRS